jgi:hypothetical protein
MLSQKETPESIEQAEAYDQGYGDLTELNNGGIIYEIDRPGTPEKLFQ